MEQITSTCASAHGDLFAVQVRKGPGDVAGHCVLISSWNLTARKSDFLAASHSPSTRGTAYIIGVSHLT